jgi:hypothetical protein
MALFAALVTVRINSSPSRTNFPVPTDTAAGYVARRVCAI